VELQISAEKLQRILQDFCSRFCFLQQIFCRIPAVVLSEASDCWGFTGKTGQPLYGREKATYGAAHAATPAIASQPARFLRVLTAYAKRDKMSAVFAGFGVY
jgi:hypothetical protein